MLERRLGPEPVYGHGDCFLHFVTRHFTNALLAGVSVQGVIVGNNGGFGGRCFDNGGGNYRGGWCFNNRFNGGRFGDHFGNGCFGYVGQRWLGLRALM